VRVNTVATCSCPLQIPGSLHTGSLVVRALVAAGRSRVQFQHTRRLSLCHELVAGYTGHSPMYLLTSSGHESWGLSMPLNIAEVSGMCIVRRQNWMMLFCGNFHLSKLDHKTFRRPTIFHDWVCRGTCSVDRHTEHSLVGFLRQTQHLQRLKDPTTTLRA
jgi:hypothetical protein